MPSNHKNGNVINSFWEWKVLIIVEWKIRLEDNNKSS